MHIGDTGQYIRVPNLSNKLGIRISYQLFSETQFFIIFKASVTVCQVDVFADGNHFQLYAAISIICRKYIIYISGPDVQFSSEFRNEVNTAILWVPRWITYNLWYGKDKVQLALGRLGNIKKGGTSG